MFETACKMPSLYLPDLNITLFSGQCVKLGRFETTLWRVMFGWYAWGGNRKTCGWHLINMSDQTVKPLYDTDLDDIYLIKN